MRVAASLAVVTLLLGCSGGDPAPDPDHERDGGAASELFEVERVSGVVYGSGLVDVTTEPAE